MKRKTFLIGTAAAVTAVAIPLTYRQCNKKNSITNPWTTPLVLSHIGDEKLLQEIGEEYRIRVPEENNKEKLINFLKTDAIKSTNADEISQFLEKKDQSDFKNGKVKVIKGWILSETELRQCALFSLT